MSSYSFIIPVFNCEKYLESCVKSVMEIGLEHFEIILVDDGSADGSGGLCDTLETHYAQVKCIHQSNQGVSCARNRGLRIAGGDYVAFIDADDAINPTAFRKMLERLCQDPTIDMAVFGISFDYYYHGRCYRRDTLPPALTGRLSRDVWVGELSRLYETNALSPIWNKVIRRSLLVKYKLELREDMFLYEDLEFSLRCMARCGTILFFSDIVYHYRQAEDEGNAGRRLKRIKHLPELIEQVEAALNDLSGNQKMQEKHDAINSILLSLYLVLMRVKIAVSTSREIKMICQDFSQWWAVHAQPPGGENKRFIDELLNEKVVQLIFERVYVAARHKVAVRVKGILKRWVSMER